MTTRSGSVSANCGPSFPCGVFCVPATPIEVQSGPTRGGAEFADTGRVSGGAEQYPSTWGSPILPSSAGPATQRLLCSIEQASIFLRQFEVVARIKTLQLRRMLKGVGSEVKRNISM